MDGTDGRDEDVVTDAERQGWPRTVEEAVDRLLERLSAEDTATIREMEMGEMTAALHFTLGMYVRNQYGLWRGNDALLAACAGRPVEHARLIHPDDASGVILAALWRRLRATG